MAVGTRARIVSSQNGEHQVSSVVLSLEESVEHLHAEASLHESAGWSVVRFERGFVALRNGLTRRVWLRFTDPMDDLL